MIVMAVALGVGLIGLVLLIRAFVREGATLLLPTAIVSIGLAASWLFGVWYCDGFEREDYPVGRDTVDFFGNARFQIGRVGPDNRERWLFDSTQVLGLLQVADWRRRGDFVLVLGTDGRYTVLNYRTGRYRTYARLDDMPVGLRSGAKRLRLTPPRTRWMPDVCLLSGQLLIVLVAVFVAGLTLRALRRRKKERAQG